MQLLKKKPLRGGYWHSFLENWEKVLFCEMGRILCLDEKEEGSGLHIVAWMKPTDVSGVTYLDFNYFSQTYSVNLCSNIKNSFTQTVPWAGPPCCGLFLYLQEPTVIFLLHLESSNISVQNQNFIHPIFPLSLCYVKTSSPSSLQTFLLYIAPSCSIKKL